MGASSCLACNRAVVSKQRESVITAMAKRITCSRVYPHVYRLLGKLPLCAGCLEASPFLERNLCRTCGRQMKEQGMCGDCQTAPDDTLQYNRSLLRYEGWVRERISTFKYRGDERWADCFALLLAIGYLRFFREERISCITFVPIHEARLRERGFNQAELLATRLGALVKLPVEALLMRIRDTDKQSKQAGRHARLASMKDAFALQKHHGIGHG
ncbi:MAG: ComF family protein, partial [Clostridia bacterium]